MLTKRAGIYVSIHIRVDGILVEETCVHNAVFYHTQCSASNMIANPQADCFIVSSSKLRNSIAERRKGGYLRGQKVTLAIDAREPR